MPAGSRFLIEEGMVSKSIEEIAVRGEAYYRIGLRNQLLHAVHPLGWISELILKIDGEEIPKDQVFFEVRNQWVGTDVMPTIRDIYWYICEGAHLYVKKKKALARGRHDISCEFVASQLEVSTLVDADQWPRRRQTVLVRADFQKEDKK